jgi:transposase
MTRRADRDGKVEALSASRTLNTRAERVSDPQFAAGEFFDARDLVQVKYEMVRRVESEEMTVAEAAAAFGFSRQSVYTAQDVLASDGLAALVPAKPGPRGGHKLTEEVVNHLLGLLAGDPGVGSKELAAAVLARFGVSVHPRSVERGLARRRAVEEAPKSG